MRFTGWFLNLLEQLANSHGVRALAEFQYMANRVPFGNSLDEKGGK